MIKCERTYPAPESLAKRQAYNEADVISRLKAIFYDKCYICGLKGLEKSAHRKRLVRARLNRTSAFAAFKRDYIR